MNEQMKVEYKGYKISLNRQYQGPFEKGVLSIEYPNGYIYESRFVCSVADEDIIQEAKNLIESSFFKEKY